LIRFAVVRSTKFELVINPQDPMSVLTRRVAIDANARRRGDRI